LRTRMLVLEDAAWAVAYPARVDDAHASARVNGHTELHVSLRIQIARLEES